MRRRQHVGWQMTLVVGLATLAALATRGGRGGSGGEPTRVAADAPPCVLARDYRYEARFDVENEGAAAGADTVPALAALLVRRLVAEDATSRLYAWDVREATTGSWRGALYALEDRDGRITRLLRSRDVDEGALTPLKSAALSAQAVRRSERRFAAEQPDMTGVLASDYEWAEPGRRLVRTGRRYATLHAGVTGRVTLDESRSAYELDGTGWLAGLAQTERARLALAGGVAVSSRAEVRLSAEGPAPEPLATTGRCGLSAPAAEVAARGLVDATFTPAASAAAVAARFPAGASATDAAPLLARLTGGELTADKARAISQLIDLATLKPAVLEELLAELRKAADDLDRAAWLVGVLARVPTAEGQAALLKAMTEHAGRPRLLRYLVEAHHFAPRPAGENVARLLALADRPGALGTAALLAAGTAAGRADDADLRRRTGESLLRRLDDAETPAARAAALTALGNLGDPAALPVLAAQAAGDDDGAATAALHALRRIATPEAEAALVDAAVSQRAPAVRVAGLEALTGRTLAPSSLASVMGSYAGFGQEAPDTADRLRLLGLDVLTAPAHAARPEVRRFLEELRARKDLSPLERKRLDAYAARSQGDGA